MIELSVIIPTYQRPAKLAACLEGLARQSLDPSSYEVLVGLDGPDADSSAAARRACGPGANLRVIECPRQGLNATRNRILAVARGRIMVSLNDDVRPSAELLAAHADAHRTSRDQPAVVVGHSPFVRWDSPSLFDDLCAATSMIFFYDAMIDPESGELTDPDPSRDWGFRHCWGLNFSAPLALVREVGGFTAFDRQYGYDDIEIAWRMRRRYASPVLFRPEAHADHDHRYGPAEVLRREFKLGISAWLFAGREPEFARDVFGRDIRAADELAYSTEFVSREAAAARRLERTFLQLDRIAAASIGVQQRILILRALAQQHLLLKRWVWRRGLLHAATGAPEYDPQASE